MSLYGSPQLKQSVDNQRGQSFRGMNSVIQGTKAAVNTGATGAIVHGTQDAFSGNRAKAISEYQSVPGQLWQGLERDPIGGAVTIAAGFGIGGSILDTGAAIATKVAECFAGATGHRTKYCLQVVPKLSSGPLLCHRRSTYGCCERVTEQSHK